MKSKIVNLSRPVKALALLTLCLLAVALAALLTPTPKAHADPVTDYYGPQTAVIGSGTAVQTVAGSGLWTNVIAATASWSNYTRFGPITGKDVFIQLQAQASGANSGALTLWMGRNADGLGFGNPAGFTNIEQFLIWNPGNMNGTTRVTYCTNLTSQNGFGGAIGYLYFNTVSNAGAASITNYSIKVLQR